MVNVNTARLLVAISAENLFLCLLSLSLCIITLINDLMGLIKHLHPHSHLSEEALVFIQLSHSFIMYVCVSG